MIGSRLVRAALIVGIAAQSIAARAAAIGLPPAEATWRSLETANFRLVGDAPPAEMRELGEGLERFRAALLWLAPRSKDRSPVPTLVLVFADERGFSPYGGVGFDAADPRRLGAFHRTRWGNYMLIDASATLEEPLAIVLKGYVHFFVGSSYPSTPFWVSTGLAEYFSSFRTGAEGLEVGRPVGLLVEVLRSRPRLPVARLLEIGRLDPEPRDPETALLYRAKAWAFVHWALAGEPERAPAVVDLLRRLDRGEPAASALPAAFGMSAEELESRLDAYVRQPAFRYRIYSDEELPRPELAAPAPISRSEAFGLLGEFLVHAGAGEEARAHLEAAVGADSENGDAVALQGHLEELAGRLDRADELYARAVSLPERRASSASHAAHFWIARAVAAADSERRRSELEKARRAAARAIDLDSDYGEPWALRGLIELHAGEADAAVVTLAEAHRRLPDRGDVLFNRFLANLQAGQLVVARSIASGSLRRLDPELAAEAERRLGSSSGTDLIAEAVAEVKRRFEAGELDAVAEPLRAALAQVTDPRQRESLEAQIALVESKAAEKRLVVRYNQAVNLANAGEHVRAKAVLDEMLAGCGAQPVCGNARSFREQLVAILSRQ